MRRNVPLAITFICGVFAIASFFFNEETAPSFLANKLKEFGVILGAFAVVLGTGNIIRVTVHKARRGEDRPYKIVLLVCLFITLGLGLYLGILEKVQGNWLGGYGLEGNANPFYWIYHNIQLPLGATMFSLLVFFITSAAYRAFRMRSVEAGLLLVAAVIVMIGQVPTGIDEITAVKEWIMAVPNVAAKRAILMGAAMGIAAMSLRVILGIERSYLGGD